MGLTTLAMLASGTAASYARNLSLDPGDQKLSISTRLNPAYDPQGIRMGDFILSPSITSGMKYNDNIYATDLNRMHDFIYTVKPDIRFRSDFVRHSLSGGMFFERGVYNDITSENYSDYGGSLGARIDVTGQTSIPFDLSYTRQHIRRGGPDERAAIEPTFMKVVNGTIGLVHQGRLLAMKIIAGLQRFVFENAIGTSGIVLDNGDRDRNEYSLYTSIGLDSNAIFAPFLYTNILKINYDRPFDDSGLNRDAMQYEGGIGTVINFSDITSASFTLGRIHRTVDDPTLNDINDFSYGVNLKWEPSTLASFLLSGDRTVKESTTAGVTASVASSLRLSMDYELFPNLIVQPSAGIVQRDYRGDNGGRTVSTDGTLQFTYKMNPNFWLTTTYQHVDQEEKEPTPNEESYKSNIYGINLKLQF